MRMKMVIGIGFGVPLFFALLWCVSPSQAVQRVDYTDLTSDQLLATEDIQNSPQDVQIIGDRLIVRIEQPCPTGGRYRWQAVFRAVTTFQREATGPHELIPEYAVDSAEVNKGKADANWRDETYWRRRWEEHRNEARGVTLEQREQIRAMGESN